MPEADRTAQSDKKEELLKLRATEVTASKKQFQSAPAACEEKK